MSEEVSIGETKPKQLHFALLLVISFVLFNGAYVVDQIFRWSNHLEGLMGGIIHVMFFMVPWAMILLPWSLLVLALYKWRGWQRWRTHVVLAPSYLVMLLSIAGLVFQPPTPSRRFESRTGIELPENAQKLRYHFSGGGFIDYTDIYCFETTPEEVDRLIRGMGMNGDGSMLEKVNGHTSVQYIPGFPDFRKWPGAVEYSKFDFPNTGWFYHLITDESRTKVYIMIGCI